MIQPRVNHCTLYIVKINFIFILLACRNGAIYDICKPMCIFVINTHMLGPTQTFNIIILNEVFYDV